MDYSLTADRADAFLVQKPLASPEILSRLVVLSDFDNYFRFFFLFERERIFIRRFLKFEYQKHQY